MMYDLTEENITSERDKKVQNWRNLDKEFWRGNNLDTSRAIFRPTAGGAWQMLSAVCTSRPTCLTCIPPTPFLGHTSNSPPPLPTQTLPAVAEQPGSTQHVLYEQASLLLTRIGKGSKGWLAFMCQNICAAIFLWWSWRIWAAGWLWCESVSSYILQSVWERRRHSSKLDQQHRMTEHGVGWGLQFCLQRWVPFFSYLTGAFLEN